MGQFEEALGGIKCFMFIRDDEFTELHDFTKEMDLRCFQLTSWILKSCSNAGMDLTWSTWNAQCRRVWRALLKSME